MQMARGKKRKERVRDAAEGVRGETSMRISGGRRGGEDAWSLLVELTGLLLRCSQQEEGADSGRQPAGDAGCTVLN